MNRYMGVNWSTTTTALVALDIGRLTRRKNFTCREPDAYALAIIKEVQRSR